MKKCSCGDKATHSIPMHGWQVYVYDKCAESARIKGYEVRKIDD